MGWLCESAITDLFAIILQADVILKLTVIHHCTLHRVVPKKVQKNIMGVRSLSETVYHRTAKQIILETCQSAGWDATLEVAGGGWRADVLAQRGNVKLAFEVQWSHLRLDDTLERQERYAADGIRGCWFFRTPPNWLIRHEPSAPRQDGGLRAWKKLPLFHLIASATGTFSVRMNDDLTPLDSFVNVLLQGKIRHCDVVRAEAGSAQHATVTFFEARCPTCSRLTRTYAVDASLVGLCGTRFSETNHETLVNHAQIIELLESDPGKASRVCRHCQSALDSETIYYARYGIHREPTYRLDLELERGISAKLPHWCYPKGERHCC
jgi:hypothetical protein